MKFKSLLTIFMIVPFVVMGQNKVTKSEDAKVSAAKLDTVPGTRSSMELNAAEKTYTAGHPVVFFNEGAVFFDKKKDAVELNKADLSGSKENQIMFVEGSMEADKPSAPKPPVFKMANQSAIAVIGDVENLVFDMKDHVEGSVTTKCETGMVWFVSDKSTPTAITNSEAKLIPFYIQDPAKQALAKLQLTGGAMTLRKKQRILSYNVLPNVVVDEYSYVSLEVDPKKTFVTPTALSIGELNPATAAAKKGELIVGSGGLFSLKASPSTAVAREMVIPTFVVNAPVSRLVKGQVRGQEMYDLELYKTDGTTIDGVGDNTLTGGALTVAPPHSVKPGSEGKKKVFTPFSSPFKGLGADHMIFNVLTKPSIGHVGGGAEGPIVDPLTGIKGGQAYFIGVDIGDFDYAEIEANNPGVLFRKNRAVRGYQFNREYFLKEHPGFNKSPGMYDQETFSSLADDYTFELKDGLNFLANPYAARLDFSNLLTLGSLNADWVSSGNIMLVTKPDDIKDVTTTALRPTVWFPHSASIQYYTLLENGHTSVPFFRYNISYAERQIAGGTWTDTNMIPPLGVFALQANVPSGATTPPVIKIPKSKLFMPVLANVNPPTPRSTVEVERVDELLLETKIQALDALADDATSSMTDRLSIVLRQNASFAYRAVQAASDDHIDNEKLTMISDPSSVLSPSKRNAKTDDALAIARKYPGSLYAVSSDQKALITTAIPNTVKQLPVYFTPTDIKTRVTMRPFRMETLQTVQRVWLLDKFADNKVVELTPETEYEFLSEPIADEALANENRFVLYFDVEPGDGDGGNVIGKDMPIYCYYNVSTLYVRQLNDDDMGSKVSIYDLQGRLAGDTKITYVDGEGKFEYMKPLAYGTYIVKITGKRNYTTKIMVTP